MAEHPLASELHRMDKIIKKLLIRNNDGFDAVLMQNLNSACKGNKENIDKAFELILHHMQKPHSQLRLYALDLIHTLFLKSNHFQSLVLDKALFIVSLCLQDPMSPPLDYASKLERRIGVVVSQWTNLFPHISQLALILSHITTSTQDRTWLDVQTVFATERESLRRTRTKMMRLERYLAVVETFSDTRVRLEGYLGQMERGVGVLVPEFGDERVFAKEGRVVAADGRTLAGYGLAGTQYALEIDFSGVVKETRENCVLFDAVRENRAVLITFQAQIDDWLLLSSQAEDPDKERNDAFLKTLIDIKIRLLNSLETSKTLLDASHIEEESDEEFEDVEGMDDVVATPVNQNFKLIPPVSVKSYTGLAQVFNDRKGQEQDPTISSATPEPLQSNSTNPPSHLSELFKLAPVVEFDQDLEFWSKEAISFEDVSKHAGMEFKHRFLGEGSSDRQLSSKAVEDLKKRVVYLDSEAGRVEYPACGAPLTSGALCQRKDMERCPFHGLIKPRDGDGKLLDGEDETKMVPIWQKIESQYQSFAPRENERKKKLDVIEKQKVKVHKRILNKSKKLSKSSPAYIERELADRDRKVFKW